MTNEMIIFNAAQDLAEEGKINYTGKVFKAVDQEGNEIEFKETEEIHTYKEWQNLGMQVQKGQKAVAKITIWMFTNKPGKAAKAAAEAEGKEAEADPHYYMKEAAFFSASQVAPAEAKPAKENKPVELETVHSFLIDANYIDSLVNA